MTNISSNTPGSGSEIPNTGGLISPLWEASFAKLQKQKPWVAEEDITQLKELIKKLKPEWENIVWAIYQECVRRFTQSGLSVKFSNIYRKEEYFPRVNRIISSVLREYETVYPYLFTLTTDIAHQIASLHGQKFKQENSKGELLFSIIQTLKTNDIRKEELPAQIQNCFAHHIRTGFASNYVSFVPEEQVRKDKLKQERNRKLMLKHKEEEMFMLLQAYPQDEIVRFATVISQKAHDAYEDYSSQRLIDNDSFEEEDGTKDLSDFIDEELLSFYASHTSFASHPELCKNLENLIVTKNEEE